MKKLLTVFGLVLALNMCLAGVSYAAEKSPEAPLLVSFFDKIKEFLGGSAQASSTTQSTMNAPKGVLTDSGLKLLDVLNEQEMQVRTKLTGADLYLQKDTIITKLEAAKIAVVNSPEFTAEHKARITARLDTVITKLNEDLVNAPQDSINQVVLDSYDDLEAMVFNLSDSESQKMLSIIESAQIATASDKK